MAQEWTHEDEDRLRKAWADELAKKSPTIGLVGVSGVGKSSTINTMFKTRLPTSHTVACTKEFTEVPLDVSVSTGPGQGENARLIVVDAPGLGEDKRRDPEYIRMYEEALPQCDVILWIITARNRAIALDQSYLEYFSGLHDRMVFGLNQVDLVEPRNWKPGSLIPSKEQEANIREIVLDRSERLAGTLGRPVEVIPYCNYQAFNLEWLFTSILEACTTGRKWIFEGLKNFKLEDFIVAPELQYLKGSDTSENSSQSKVRQRGSVSDPAGVSPDMIRLGSQILEALTAVFGRGSSARDVLRRTIGRDDIRQKPLDENEIKRLESMLKSERVKRLKGQN